MNGETEIISKMNEEKILSAYEGEDKVIASPDLHKILLENKKRKISFKANIPSLDEIVDGFEGGELNIVSGITGEGKSLFCQSLTKNFAEQNINSLWFSYEMPSEYFLKRFPNLPLFYLPQMLKSSSLSWIETRIKEAKIKYDIQAVFVDHLHFLVSMSVLQNSSLAIGHIVREIKKIALRNNIIFFLICHTTKIKPDKELDLGDVRDSSFIEQEADNVFYIWRKRKEENQSTLKIAKNRKSGVVGKKINLHFIEGYLEEMEKL